MIKKSEQLIIVKIAITLRLLLARNKSSSQSNKEKENLVTSYEKIAINSSSDLTKATVNNAFSGKKRSAMTTIVLIVEAMGYKLCDFAEEYDKITNEEVNSFTREYNKGEN